MDAVDLAIEHKRVDAASYDAAATAFDRLTERFSAPLARRMVELAQVKSADRVIDIGTGTGLVALQASKVTTRGGVLGIDHSPGMLRQAATKARERGLEGVLEFRQMDAEHLEVPDRSFDAAVSLFVLLHLPDPGAAIRELHRVLRPGGRIVIGIGRGPTLASLTGIRHAAHCLAAEISAWRGRMLLAPRFLRTMMQEEGLWHDRPHVADAGAVDVPGLLRRAGFQGVASRWQGARVRLTPDEFWDVQATYGSTERIVLAGLPQAQAAALRETFLQRCEAVVAGGGTLVYRFGAMFYVATA